MTNQDIIQQFRDHGLRVTTHRIAVYRAVRASVHPDAETVLKMLKKEYPNITPSTVYNNLEALEKSGLIHKVLTGKGKMMYDGILAEHHHLLDMEEDMITDYFDEELTEILKTYFSKHPLKDFEVSRVMVQLFGRKKKQS